MYKHLRTLQQEEIKKGIEKAKLKDPTKKKRSQQNDNKNLIQ